MLILIQVNFLFYGIGQKKKNWMGSEKAKSFIISLNLNDTSMA